MSLRPLLHQMSGSN